MRAEIVHCDGGRDDRRGRAEIRPVDGPHRGAVDRAVDVSLATIVLR